MKVSMNSTAHLGKYRKLRISNLFSSENKLDIDSIILFMFWFELDFSKDKTLYFKKQIRILN